MLTYSKNKQQGEQFPQMPFAQVAFIKSSYFTIENQNVT